ncbi:MAG: F0F1 ATP synthase subunit A [Defluviitaleaceae bacterium]|nr:F0F1 ATP synthase subunit A [Defluviitaleaceae bacterium]
MDLTIRNLWSIEIGNFQMYITESLRNLWIISGALILIAIFVRIKLKRFKQIPTGFQALLESIITIFEKYVRSFVGDRLAFLAYWFFTVFAFILISNISGLFFMRPPTADWSINISIAVVTLVLIHFCAIKTNAREHFRSLLRPVFLFLPINLIGEVSRPISLSFRLYGNIFSGLILTSLIYSMIPWFLMFGPPLIIHAYFDLFAGALQTFIFCTISLVLIGVFASNDETA